MCSSTMPKNDYTKPLLIVTITNAQMSTSVLFLRGHIFQDRDTSEFKQKFTQHITPFHCTVFHAFSRGFDHGWVDEKRRNVGKLSAQ